MAPWLARPTKDGTTREYQQQHQQRPQPNDRRSPNLNPSSQRPARPSPNQSSYPHPHPPSYPPSHPPSHPPPPPPPPTTNLARQQSKPKPKSKPLGVGLGIGFGRLDFYDGSQGPLPGDIDSSDSDDELNLRPRNPRPGHNRSMSHPFPSLFSLKKKSSSNLRPNTDDSEDNGTASSSGPSRRPHANPATSSSVSGPSGKMRPSPLQPRRRGPAGSKDFATGPCTTCDSPLRWPKDITTFKCTRCATVIDLQPLNPPSSARRDGMGAGSGPGGPRPGPSHVPSDGPASPRSLPRVTSISLEHTKNVVRQCLKTYVEIFLESHGRHIPDNTLHHTNPFRRPTEGLPIIKTPVATPSPFEQTPPIHVSGYFDAEVPPSLQVDNGLGPPTSNNPFLPPLSTSYPERRSRVTADDHVRPRWTDPKRIFKPLEEYLIAAFSTFECLNGAFPTRRSSMSGGPRPNMGQRPSFAGGSWPQEIRKKGSTQLDPPSERKQSFAIEMPTERKGSVTDPVLTDFDAKLLLLGDVAENGLWWTGGQEEMRPTRLPTQRSESLPPCLVNTRSPCIEWAELDEWYCTILNVAELGETIYDELVASESLEPLLQPQLREMELQLLAGQEHIRRLLLKVTEVVLKRPGRVVTEPYELRFLLVIISNPLLYSPNPGYKGKYQGVTSPRQNNFQFQPPPRRSTEPIGGTANSTGFNGPVSGHHSGIIKRVLGLIAHTPIECRNHLTSWLSRLSTRRFRQIKDLVGQFVTYRLSRQHSQGPDDVDMTGGLVPDMPSASGSNRTNAANLHAALGGPTGKQTRKGKEPPPKIVYEDDWQIRAAASVMMLIFAANNMPHSRRPEPSPSRACDLGPAKDRIQLQGQILPTSDFYNTLLDYSDLFVEYDAWESKRANFSFCQYPFFLSIWAKIKILQYDARKQMEGRAREAFFDTIMTRKAVDQHLVIKVRRECLVEDSLQSVSEVVGSGSEDIKKGLRIDFIGEEGVDAGGLRKEWFQILIREVFHPDHGMFTYDEDSQYCFFNPNSFETSDQYFLVGVVIGLAIYNSAMLDVAFPPFAFRKLLAAAPSTTMPPTSCPRQPMTYTLEDLAEFRPRLAKGLQQLLEYEGDVESTFCLDFVIDTDKYGAATQVPLCYGGEAIPVTNSNRREYVDLVVRYHLDTAVTRQFEPFKRGFFTVCGGNALGLFRPEEIELLVRGSDEPLDINSLRAVAEYENWERKPPLPRQGRMPPNPTPYEASQLQVPLRQSTSPQPAPPMPDSPPPPPPPHPPVTRPRRRSALTEQLRQSRRLSKARPEDIEPTIWWFWEAFQEASITDQRKLLTFITGSDRIPAMGATSLVIKVACLGDDCGRYPIARTCFNTIQLHRYQSKERLQNVLWGAVTMSAGFGLK